MSPRCAEHGRLVGWSAGLLARGCACSFLALMMLAGCASAPGEKAAAPDPTPNAGNSIEAASPVPAESPEALAEYERAMQRMSAGDEAGAEQDFKRLAAQYANYAGPMINLAILHAKAGRNADAEAALKQAIERNPNSAPAHNQLGILYRKLGRFKEADESYQQALRSDPNYALAHLNVGVLYDLYLEQPQRALESYERYLQLESNPQPQVKGWVKELRTRLGLREPAAAEAAPAAQPTAAPEAGA